MVVSRLTPLHSQRSTGVCGTVPDGAHPLQRSAGAAPPSL